MRLYEVEYFVDIMEPETGTVRVISSQGIPSELSIISEILLKKPYLEKFKDSIKIISQPTIIDKRENVT